MFPTTTALFALPVVFGLLAGLAALPVLIHLINMMRHRRVKWAAMDFLLASYKKHRNWVWLKQLLLLLMRVAAMLFAVMMLAGLGCQFEPLAHLLGGKPTHHYVLLDDSYSMSDRLGGASAFDNARQAVGRIAARAGLSDTPQKFTLIRFSQAQGGANPENLNSQMDQMADLNAAVVDKDFDVLLEEKRRAFDVSQLAVGPTAALGVVKQLVRQAADERPIVYVVSDFRAKEWDNPAEIRQALSDLQQAQADVQLIGCMRTEQSNLAITDLKPTDDTRAAGVPLFLNVTVKNYGAEAAKKVQIKIRSYFFDDKLAVAAEPGKLDGVPDDLPTVLIDEIRPGESVARRFQVYFPAAGKHVVEANLPEDPVAADNRRTTVIDFPEGEPVLVIDGDKNQRNAYYLTSAFEPGQRANTGIRPDLQEAAFLRDVSLESLRKYTAIYLLDVDKLEARAVANLEEYVRGGGGLGIFVGDNFNIKGSNELLYKQGEGLFPLPLERADLLPAELDENTPDIEVTDHPMFKVFLGERNPLIRSVTIEQFVRPEKGWSPDPNSTVQIIARLRNHLPLVVERQFGEGRVVAFLTSISTEWNNWSNDPSFVVVALKLQSHLASTKKIDVTHLVGVPLEVDLAADKYTKEVLFITPGDKPEARVPIDKHALKVSEKSPVMVASLGADGAASSETNRSGLYEAWPMKTDGTAEVRRYAVNVDASEGDLALTTPTQLEAKLAAIKFKFTPWDEYVADLVAQPDIKWSYWLLYALIVLLVGEQLLAYSASYHPLRGGARA
jgi:uncharacterized membrane protein